MNADNEKKTLNYGTFLADLEAKRAALDQAITSIRAVMASGALAIKAGDSMSNMADSVSVGLYGGEVPVGAFLGKSIPEAAKLCLQIVKRKMTTREITDALTKGGIETTAKTSFAAIVHSILMRTWRSGGGIVKFGRSWGLVDWLPASMRSSSALKATAKRRKKAVRGPKVAATTTAPDKVASGTIPKKLWAALSKPGAELSAQEAAESAGTKSNVAAMLLAKLVKHGSAEKTASGKYRAIRSAA